MSSGLGSLAQNSDPNWEHSAVKPLAYNSSKAALNMFTVILAHQLKDTKIKVNSADPGYTATDLNHNSGTKTVEEGASIIFDLATLPDDGATGGYFDDQGDELLTGTPGTPNADAPTRVYDVQVTVTVPGMVMVPTGQDVASGETSFSLASVKILVANNPGRNPQIFDPAKHLYSTYFTIVARKS